MNFAQTVTYVDYNFSCVALLLYMRTMEQLKMEQLKKEHLTIIIKRIIFAYNLIVSRFENAGFHAYNSKTHFSPSK